MPHYTLIFYVLSIFASDLMQFSLKIRFGFWVHVSVYCVIETDSNKNPFLIFIFFVCEVGLCFLVGKSSPCGWVETAKT
jgi:hypothetical protein